MTIFGEFYDPQFLFGMAVGVPMLVTAAALTIWLKWHDRRAEKNPR